MIKIEELNLDQNLTEKLKGIDPNNIKKKIRFTTGKERAYFVCLLSIVMKLREEIPQDYNTKIKPVAK